MALLLLIWTALLFIQRVTAQSIPCAWVHPRIGTVQDALYIDGGQYYTNTWEDGTWKRPSPVQGTVPAGELQRFNYTKPFHSDTTAPINATALMELLSLTAGGSYDAPIYADGAMFANSYELYTYGGLPLTPVKDSSTILNYRLYPVDGQSIFTPGPETSYQLPSGISNYITHGAGVSIPSENLAFYFSGKHADNYGALAINASPGDPDAASQLVDNILKIDMSSPGAATWKNLQLQPDVEPRASGQLVWVPVSTKGVLLAIGGVTEPMDLDNYAEAAVTTSNVTFIRNIPVFDVDTKQWTVQGTSTDTTPDQLADFCAVVAKAGDDKFDVFLYGGNNGVTDDYTPAGMQAQDAVWVLSVPEFVWTLVSAGTISHGRAGHACSTPYPNQMLVVGGWNQNDPGYCITDGTLLDVFDLNTLQWTHNYQPAVGGTYQRNVKITNSIASQPSQAVSTISSLFSTAYPTPVLGYWPYKPQSDKSGGSSAPIGAIVGGVIGGIAVIAVLILAWCCRPSKRKERKERKRRQSGNGTETMTQNSSVWPWLRNTPGGMPPKASDIVSDTATEVDESMSPPLQTAEVFGDTYFDPRHRSVRSNESNARPYRYSLSPAHSPLPPRSPRSMHSTSVEADGEQVHELPNESRNSKMSSELNQANYQLRSHPLYPHSIDGHLSNGAVPSDMTPPTHPSDRLGATSPGPVPSELSEHGDTNTQLTSSVSEHTGTARVVSMTRPDHKRNSSSVSSGIPVTPAPTTDDSGRRTDVGQLRQSRPISPLLQQDGPRPSHHRHGSSLSEMLLSPSGEAAVPRESEEDAEQTLVNSPTSGSLPRRKPVKSAYEATRRHLG